MADLNFLAAGVQDAALWTRPTRRKPNPFEAPLAESWEQRRVVGPNGEPFLDGDGNPLPLDSELPAIAKIRGTAKSATAYSYGDYRKIRNAIIRGARDLDIGQTMADFGPEQNEQGERAILDPGTLANEEAWQKYIGDGNAVVLFAAKPKRRVVEDK